MIKYEYSCGGCDLKESVLVHRETRPVFKGDAAFRREGGFCAKHWPTVEDRLPEGWGICLIGCVYCPSCFVGLE
jgi:hypothetical protein